MAGFSCTMAAPVKSIVNTMAPPNSVIDLNECSQPSLIFGGYVGVPEKITVQIWVMR